MLAYLFLAISIAFRFVHHPLAFTPVGASLLYFGARQPRRRMWFPLIALAAADIVLTHFVYTYPFSPDHFITWGWYAAVVTLGGVLRTNAAPLRIAGAALATAVSFFTVSNFAVWVFWRGMYPATLAGLLACYTAAIPFFRNEVVADLLFAGVMFGVGAVIGEHRPVHRKMAA